MEDNFYKNSFLLTLSNITTGILGFIFSIILSRQLGPEGMGLYGLIMPLYNLFICIICGGVITAISKLSATFYDNRDYYNLRKTIRTTFVFNILWAILIASLVFIFAPKMALYFIKDSRTTLALKIITPAMVFICLSNIFKGFFYGISKIMIPAIIDIVEKGLRIFIIIALVNYFSIKSVTASVTAAYIALAIGEFISLLLLYIYYKKNSAPLRGVYQYKEGRAQLIFNVLIISIPLCINGLITTALDALATLILPRRLLVSGIEHSVALGIIGKFAGMSMSIVFFPMIVIASISTLLIPNLSQIINKKDYYLASVRIKEVLRIALILGLCTLAIALNIPEDLGFMFYKRTDLASYIASAALCAPIFYVANCTLGILNGLGKQNIILKNSVLASCLDLLILYIFAALPRINIYAYVIGTIASSFLMLVLNFIEINKNLKLDISFLNLLYTILIGILCYFVLKLFVLYFPLVPKFLCIIIGFSFVPLSLIRISKN